MAAGLEKTRGMLRLVAGSCPTARAGAARMLPVAWRGTGEWRVLGRDDGSKAGAAGDGT
jgi:hypothetical protein